MSGPEKVEGYKCLEGTIHATLLGAARCNAKRRLMDHLTGDKNDKNRAYMFAKADLTLTEFGAAMPAPIGAIALQQEIDIVTHWVTKQPELLETVIRHFLDESGSDVLQLNRKEK